MTTVTLWLLVLSQVHDPSSTLYHMSSIHAQVISAYKEIVDNLDQQIVTEKWTTLLDRLDKFELEIGSGKYFGGKEIVPFQQWQIAFHCFC